MPIRAQWNMKGMANYLEDIAQAGIDIDVAAEKAVVAGGQIILNTMLEDVPVGKSPEDRHPGQLKSHIKMSDPVHEGNTVFVDVGIEESAPADVHIYGGVQEYGSTSNQAQPYIRPAFDKNKARVKAAQKKALHDEGLL